MKRKIILSLAVLLTSLLMLSCSNDDSSAKNQNAPQEKPQADKPVVQAPQNQGERFASIKATDVDGNIRSLSEWVGKKPVVVNFWGTWCPPCRREIPALVQLYDEYRGKGVEIVSLAIERNAGPQEVKTFGQDAGMKWVMLMSNDDAAKAFRLGGSVPTTIFYDGGGNEVARYVGARSYQDFKSVFQKISGT